MALPDQAVLDPIGPARGLIVGSALGALAWTFLANATLWLLRLAS